MTYTEYSWNGSALQTTSKTVTSYTVVTSDLVKESSEGTGKGLKSGTYVVNSDTTIEDYVYIRKNQTVDLIVKDGVTLTCKKGICCGYDTGNEYSTLNIYGTGKIVTTGESKTAGIGGRDDETNGYITIHGTTIEATGGKHGAGIGGGEGGKKPNATSPTITIFAGGITTTGGIDGAGIGGGGEDDKFGGEGGDVYISGGDITIYPGFGYTGKNSGNSSTMYELTRPSAIGHGYDDSKNGSVYIAYDKNETGKYMRVAYGEEDTPFTQYPKKEIIGIAETSKRTKKCHGSSYIHITECDHCDLEGNSVLTYTINNNGTHTKKCRYCGLCVEEEQHVLINGTCECGYSDNYTYKTVTINEKQGTSEAYAPYTTLQYVAEGSRYITPEPEHRLTDKRFIGWAVNGDTANLKQPDSVVTVNDDITLDAQYDDYYQINQNIDIPNGWITTTAYTADIDDDITFTTVPDEGYALTSFTVKADDANGEVLIEKEIENNEDSLSFKMPDRNVYVDAEFDVLNYNIDIFPSEDGTVTSSSPDGFTYFAYQAAADKTVTLTAQPDEGYKLDDILSLRFTITMNTQRLTRTKATFPGNNTAGVIAISTYKKPPSRSMRSGRRFFIAERGFRLNNVLQRLGVIKELS